MPIKDYSTTAANNTLTPPNGAPEGMAAGLVNNTIRQVMADTRSFYESGGWCDLGHVPTYVSATSFTIPTDVTAYYTVGRRIRVYGTIMGTFYGYIVSSVYSSPNTTVTVILDSGALTSNLSRVDLSFFEQLATGISAQGIVGRNKIINGDFNIWQEGISITPALTTVKYVAECFYAFVLGAATTWSRVTLGGSAGQTGCDTALQIVGVASNTHNYVVQRIESTNCTNMMAGKVFTFSAWIYSFSGTFSPSLAIKTPTVGDNYTSTNTLTTLALGSVPATTWTKISGTFTCTNECLKGLMVELSIGGILAGQTVLITGFQIEEGVVGTPFEKRLFSIELLNCQRYYETGFALMETYGLAGGVCSMTPYFKATKRTNPVVAVADNGSVWMTGAFAVPSVSSDSFRLTRNKDGTTGHYFMSAFWTANARL